MQQLSGRLGDNVSQKLPKAARVLFGGGGFSLEESESLFREHPVMFFVICYIIPFARSKKILGDDFDFFSSLIKQILVKEMALMVSILCFVIATWLSWLDAHPSPLLQFQCP